MGSLPSSFIKSPAVRLKLYVLFTDTPGGDTNRSITYSQGSYRRAVKVRAASIRDAYLQLAQQIVSVKNGAGIVSLNRHDTGTRRDDRGWNADVEALIPAWLRQTKTKQDAYAREDARCAAALRSEAGKMRMAAYRERCERGL
jgi:hypothetical protein